jgi:hypothetical protein
MGSYMSLILARGLRIAAPDDLRALRDIARRDLRLWGRVSTYLQPDVRQAIEAIDRETRAGWDDPELGAILEGPLAQLRTSGLDLLAVIEHEPVSARGEIATAHLYVVLRGSYFRTGELLCDTPVHRFDPDCPDAAGELLAALKGITSVAHFPDRDAVLKAYESAVPWCDCSRRPAAA